MAANISLTNTGDLPLLTNVTQPPLFLLTAWVQGISGLFAWLAMLIASHHIYQHLRCSRLRVRFVAEHFVLRQQCLHLLQYGPRRVRSLCYEYLGGESNIMAEIRGRPIKHGYLSCTCCLAGKHYTIEFLRFCKQATLQFCFVKPMMALLTLVLMPLGRYEEGRWSPQEAYLYITIIYNISVSLALYGLFLFYRATKEMLNPYSPVLKFLTVKSVIFLSFWQGVLLALLGATSAIQPVVDGSGRVLISTGTIAGGYQSFLVCIEMCLAAIALRFAFPISVYAGANIRTCTFERRQVTLQSISSSLKETMNPRDIMQDAIHNFHPQYQQYTQF